MRHVLEFLVAVLATVNLSACGSRLKATDLAQQRPVHALAILLDRSPSGRGVLKLRCAEASARIREALAASSGARLEVALYATGSARSEHEPDVLIPFTSVVVKSRPFEPPEAKAARLRTLLDALGSRCSEALAARTKTDPTDESPVYLGIGRLVEAIVARCGQLALTGREACTLRTVAIHSDMRESVHRPMAARLTAARAGRADLPEVPSIGSKDVVFAVCGVSQVEGRVATGAQSVSGLVRAWSPVLGSGAPAGFDPSCPAG